MSAGQWETTLTAALERRPFACPPMEAWAAAAAELFARSRTVPATEENMAT